MHFYWQNLNEDRDGDVKGWPFHGRAWLRFGDRLCFKFSWNLWAHFIHAYLRADASEREVNWSLAFMPLAFWFSVEWSGLSSILRRLIPGYEERELGASFHDGTLYWHGWSSSNEWRSNDRWYRRGSFNFLDFLLGRSSSNEEELEAREVLIPMPERSYRAHAKFVRRIYKRPRWFARRYFAVDMKMHDGEQIPMPGKGENSWDCGNDATFGLYTPASSIEEAIGNLVSGVLRDRWRRGGTHQPPEPERRAAVG